MANKIYQQEETAIVYGSEVGDDVAWSTESIADGAGRQSAFLDRGAAPRAARFDYRFFTQIQATPTLGAGVHLFLKTAAASAAHPDNDDGTGDAAVSAEDKLRNLKFLATAIADEAAANIEFVASGTLYCSARQMAFALWNESGASITTDAAETKLTLTPIPDELQ